MSQWVGSAQSVLYSFKTDQYLISICLVLNTRNQITPKKNQPVRYPNYQLYQSPLCQRQQKICISNQYILLVLIDFCPVWSELFTLSSVTKTLVLLKEPGPSLIWEGGPVCFSRFYWRFLAKKLKILWKPNWNWNSVLTSFPRIFVFILTLQPDLT